MVAKLDFYGNFGMIRLMKIFLLSLVVSVALAILWLTTAVALQISPQSYFDLSAPIWHMVLHVVFVSGLFWAGLQGMNLFWDWQSERTGKLRPHQPPSPQK